MIHQEFVLTQGPSNERLFDCLRLGQTINELRVVEFWGIYKDEQDKGGTLLPIEIEGVHCSGKQGVWFFWGRRKQITSGDRWVPIWESKYVDFAFGRWNVIQRQGIVKFGDSSFFDIPVSKEEMERIVDENI
ncbi:MAG TPA: hypothetical protein DIC35_05530 [Candidatus Moranbacteria bacterium]|nr:hypothetical protein [Candidatus Moranbacteria bacterium]